jgi:uncharacterized protein
MSSESSWIAKYGSTAVVTGASDGIGKEMATLLAERGLDLVLVARRRPLLETLAADLKRRFNRSITVIDADLSQAADVERVLAATKSHDVGLFVAAAGFGTAGAFLETSLDTELNMLDLNARSVLAMTHHYARQFAARGRGGIILVSSLVAFQGVPLQANYAATKAYIHSFAEALAVELAPRGVDVLVSAPGPIATGFATRANMQMGQALTAEEVARDTVNALGRKSYVRPGFLSKFLIGALGFLPRPVRVRVMYSIMRGMTQHQTTSVTTSVKQSA